MKHSTLPYITWGFIQDAKNKKKEIPNILHSYLLLDHCLGNQKIKQEEYRSSGSSNSNVWDELNFEKAETLKVPCLGKYYSRMK